MRRRYQIEVKDINQFKNKAIHWASSSFSHFSYYNGNEQVYPYTSFKNLLAVGAQKIIEFNGTSDFEILKRQFEKEKDWLFGYFGYDLKNQLEKLESKKINHQNFHDIFFYSPKHLIEFTDNKVLIESLKNPEEIFHEINAFHIKSKLKTTVKSNFSIEQEINKDEYCSIVNKIKDHIVEGDVYELNMCIGFHCKMDEFNSVETYQKLIKNSPTPFSVFQKIKDQYLMCASPERFLKKEGKKLITQPIKGTISRGATDNEDKIQADLLHNNEKERAENMMIVDLVRNDLARSCKAGTVKVEEIFGIYPFQHLFQMISTVTGELKEDVHFVDAIKNAFPMGSMTGAPKIMAMELIENYEKSKRGLFSGAVGYFTPDQNFDFNVVIRSIFYNHQNQQLSFKAGSAITYDSIPEKEYEECMLKVKAIKKVLDA